MRNAEAKRKQEAKAAYLAKWTKQRNEVGSWIRPFLLPFMVYVALACPLALLIPAYDYHHHNNGNLSLIMPGYGISRYVLLVGGLAFLMFGRTRDCIIALVLSVVSHIIYTHSWFHL